MSELKSELRQERKLELQSSVSRINHAVSAGKGSSESLIKIFPKSNNQEAVSPFLEMQWCIEASLATWIKEERIPNPHILLLNTADGRELGRKIIPLVQGSTFMDFHRGGENMVHAYLIFGDEVARMKKKFRSVMIWEDKSYYNDEGGLEYSVKKGKCRETSGEFLDLNTTIVMHIDEELFAKEPHPTLKFLVNLWHEGKLDDECHWRQRLGLLLAFKWMAILIFVVTKVTLQLVYSVMLFLSGHFKNIKWGTVAHPFIGDFDTPWYGLLQHNNFFWGTMRIMGKEVPRAILTPFMPMIWVAAPSAIAIALMVAKGAAFIDAIIMGLMTTAVIAAIACGVMTMVGLMILIILSIKSMCVKQEIFKKLKPLGNSIGEYFSRVEEKVMNIFGLGGPTLEKQEKLNKSTQAQLKRLACPLDPKKPYVSPRNDTFVLRMERIKAKVCKPFPK